MSLIDCERRKFIRLPSQFPVHYIHLMNGGGQPQLYTDSDQTGVATNTSKNGITFITFNNLTPGDLLGLIISLPFREKTRKISISGKVIWTKETNGKELPEDFLKHFEYLCGIEFFKCPNLAIIHEFIEYWKSSINFPTPL